MIIDESIACHSEHSKESPTTLSQVAQCGGDSPRLRPGQMSLPHLHLHVICLANHASVGRSHRTGVLR